MSVLQCIVLTPSSTTLFSAASQSLRRLTACCVRSCVTDRVVARQSNDERNRRGDMPIYQDDTVGDVRARIVSVRSSPWQHSSHAIARSHSVKQLAVLPLMKEIRRHHLVLSRSTGGAKRW